MSEEQLGAMSEEQIRARYRCAPAYYLRAKLEKKRALERCKAARAQARPAASEQPRATLPESASPDIIEPLDVATVHLDSGPASPDVAAAHPDAEPASPDVAAVHLDAEPASLDFSLPLPDAEPVDLGIEPMSLDIALPGFEILDAALSAVDYLDNPPDEQPQTEPGPTQQAILEAALEDYGNWPFVSDAQAKPEPEPEPELERKLRLVLEAEPDLELVLEGDPELDLVLESESDPQPIPDNVTVADFRSRAPRTVRVVSVVMDRKRPYLVRVVGETTRLAS
jgi:hypothetical protein